MHTDTEWKFSEERRGYSRKLYSYSQAKWLDDYHTITSFEPMVDDYEAGNESIEECLHFNIEWLLSWAQEEMSHLRERIASIT